MVKFLAVALARDQRGLALQIGLFDRHKPLVQFLFVLSCSALLVRSCALRLFRPSSLVAIAAARQGAAVGSLQRGKDRKDSALVVAAPLIDE
jgi:hypothetical protein